MKHLALAALLGSLFACGGADPGKPTTADAAPKAEPGQAATDPGKVEPAAKTEAAKAEPAKAEVAAPDPALVPAAPPGEVAIQPWTTRPHTVTWRRVAEPSEALSLVDLQAGILARAGTSWYQLGEGETLELVAFDGEPQLPILGTWPSDAWFVESREHEENFDDEESVFQLRLMKLRGARWVPQVWDGGGGEQWFHPGTDHEAQAHISTLSGMLVYTDEFDSITRVAGKHEDPVIGPHRGRVVGFVETGANKVYVFSVAPEGYFAQIACEDEACVAQNAEKLPMPEWVFGRAVPRGRHSVSVLATGCLSRADAGTTCDPASAREFILHHRGKSDGWLLDELPAGEQPTGMWASEEGGLWTLTGERLRWRDTQSVWHDVALPEGLTGPSIALGEDRKQIWIAGQVAGATQVFTAVANAEVAAPAP